MRKHLPKLPVIIGFLTLITGAVFDFYTNKLGLKDKFYGTSITSHMVYDSNFLGMFTAIAFLVLNILLIAGYGYLFRREKKKVKFFPALYTIIVFCYVLYIFIQGVTYMIEVLRAG